MDRKLTVKRWAQSLQKARSGLLATAHAVFSILTAPLSAENLEQKISPKVQQTEIMVDGMNRQGMQILH
jgi:hypothetical protein